MNVLSKQECDAWLARASVGTHPKWHALAFIPLVEHSRFYTLPRTPSDHLVLLEDIFGGLDPWSHAVMISKYGSYDDGQPPDIDEYFVRTVLRGLGLPEQIARGWRGALEVMSTERSAVIALLATYTLVNTCPPQDVYFIPDHGQQIVMTDHHDVVHIECRNEQRMLEFVGHMSRAGSELPTELPDATFKRPIWMGTN